MAKSSEDDLRARARDLLLDPKRVYSGVRRGIPYRFRAPSVRFYYPPFQWFWDSCFHTIALSALGERAAAKDEIRALVAFQHRSGFLPHVTFWEKKRIRRFPWDLSYQETRGRLFFPFVRKPATTELIQPPVIAQAVASIFNAEGDRSFLSEIVPKLNRYYDYLLTVRDPDHDHLISITQRFESGLDWSPAYDAADGFHGVPPSGAALWRRGWRTRLSNLWRFNYNTKKVLQRGRFHVEDVAVNSILSLNLRELARLNAAIGEHAKAAHYDAEGVAVRTALLEKCYDAERGAFFNLTGRDERRIPVLTIHSLFPLILPDLPKDIATALVSRHLLNPKEFWLPFPVPSVARSEPSFAKPIKPFLHLPFRFTWRDGTWINANWYLIHGLRRHGFYNVAHTLTEKTRELVSTRGFYEYFDPETGEGHGAPDLGWSTLVIDL